MKVILYCEGETEIGLKRSLDNNLGIATDVKKFQGVSDLLKNIGKVTRAGAVNHAPAVFCLVDLYNIHEHLSGSMKNVPNKNTWLGMTVTARVSWLKENIKSQLIGKDYRKFCHIHVAVHEIEAWMIADTENLKKVLGDDQVKIPNSLPEEINDQKPPSKRLDDIFKKSGKYGYIKTVHGVKILEKMNIEIVKEKCPHFNEFVKDLRKASKK